jgi:PAS domain S-box-containing protein
VKRTRKPPTTSDKRTLLAVEASGIGTWSWDVSTDVIELDARAKALIGLPKTARIRIRPDLLAHLQPQDRKLAEDAIKHVLETRGDYDIAHRVTKPDGSVHWIRFIGGFLKKKDPKRVMGVVFEVPWLQRSEAKHHLAEERLRQANEELERRVQERTAELERTTAQVLQQSRLLDLANDAIFVRGIDDRVSYWNEGAERLYGWTRKEAIGRSTHELLHTVFPIPLSEIMSRDRWEGELRHTRRDGITITVESRWTTLRDPEGRPVGWLELNTDISRRKASEQAAMRLSSRILKLQDEERRKMGRELHDGVGQYLTILKINLDLLAVEIPENQRTPELAERLADCAEAVNKCISETRTLSHLLHPPLLDEAGLSSAARWYLEGFAKRSNLRVETDIPSGLPRLPGNAELALFRVLQECLTNVHRHSGCTAVEVTIKTSADEVTLQVKDNGRGVSEAALTAFRERRGDLGIGLVGMRERLQQLNGRLEVKSGSDGTTVIAVLRLRAAPER